MLVRDELAELIRHIADKGDEEDQALVILVSRAVKRGDQVLAHDLSAVPPRSEEGISILMKADCPVLARLAGVCDPIETLAWWRALVHAATRSDLRRVRVLLNLAARRCTN